MNRNQDPGLLGGNIPGPAQLYLTAQRKLETGLADIRAQGVDTDRVIFDKAKFAPAVVAGSDTTRLLSISRSGDEFTNVHYIDLALFADGSPYNALHMFNWPDPVSADPEIEEAISPKNEFSVLVSEEMPPILLRLSVGQGAQHGFISRTDFLAASHLQLDDASSLELRRVLEHGEFANKAEYGSQYEI